MAVFTFSLTALLASYFSFSTAMFLRGGSDSTLVASSFRRCLSLLGGNVVDDSSSLPTFTFGFEEEDQRVPPP